MASDYDGQTVAELKEVLRQRGLPVSGAKGVLVARLEEDDARASSEATPSETSTEHTTSPDAVQSNEDKHHFGCRVCGVTLAVPVGYTGDVECPACRTRQPVGRVATSEERYPFDLTRNQWSLAVSIAGVAVGLLAIFVFFSAFSYEVMCPEEARGEVVQDGQTYKSCDGGTWGPTLNRLFVSCCLMVPFAASLTQAGLSLRRPQVQIQQRMQSVGGSSSTPAEASTSQSQRQFTDSPSAELLQRIAKWFGVGLTAASTLLVLVGAAVVVLLIYLLLTTSVFPY